MAKTTEDFCDNLFWALWYNGLEGDVEHLAAHLGREEGKVSRKDVGLYVCCESMELLWMALVQCFGDYGASPRSGWITDTRGAARFLGAAIERTWGGCDG